MMIANVSAIAAGMVAALLAVSPLYGAQETADACTTSTRSIRQLAMIDHTSDGGFQCLGVFVQGDTIKAIRLEKHKPTTGHPGAEQVNVIQYPTEAVDSAHGAVIDGIPGHDAIVLRGHFSTPPGTGELRISYLYNGLTGEFHSCPIGLDRTPNAGWRLVNGRDQTVSLIGVRIRQLPLIGVVGIANLEGACM